jgi:ribosomal protein L13E
MKENAMATRERKTSKKRTTAKSKAQTPKKTLEETRELQRTLLDPVVSLGRGLVVSRLTGLSLLADRLHDIPGKMLEAFSEELDSGK